MEFVTAAMAAGVGDSPAPPDGEARPLPANLYVPKVFRDVVARMWQRSATFRGQAARIAAEPSLTVRVVATLTPPPGGTRAHAELVLSPQGRLATIWIAPHDVVELLAHELEHVVEWLDDADYAVNDHARLRATARNAAGVETLRAQRAGQLVAREVGRAWR